MKVLSSGLLRLHRLLLVGGTVVVAISGSTIAQSGTEISALCFLASGGALMVAADIASEVETAAQQLSTSSGLPTSSSRKDILDKDGHGSMIGGVALAIVLAVIGVLL